MLFKLLNLNLNLALTLGYLNPALNNSALYTKLLSQFRTVHTYGTGNTRTGKQNCLKPLSDVNSILVGLFGIHLQLSFGHMLTFISLYRGTFTFAFLDCVRYHEDFVKSRFVISKFCSMHFVVILAGLKKIVRYTDEFVIKRFHCMKGF